MHLSEKVRMRFAHRARLGTATEQRQLCPMQNMCVLIVCQRDPQSSRQAHGVPTIEPAWSTEAGSTRADVGVAGQSDLDHARAGDTLSSHCPCSRLLEVTLVGVSCCQRSTGALKHHPVESQHLLQSSAMCIKRIRGPWVLAADGTTNCAILTVTGFLGMVLGLWNPTCNDGEHDSFVNGRMLSPLL